MAAARPRFLGIRAVWILFIVLCQSRRSHGGFVVVPYAPSKSYYQSCSTAIHKNIRTDTKSWRRSPSCQEPQQQHCKPTTTSIFITSRGPAAFSQRRKTLLAKTKEEDDSSNKEEEKGGVFRSLNFWSNKDSDDSPKPDQEQEEEPKGQGIFRFFNRGSNEDDDDESEEGDVGNRKKRKKQKSTSNKKDDSDDADDDDQGEGGFLKSITKRVFGKDKDENPETIEEQSLDLIDTRPTFITFQRSSPQPSRVPPKEGTKAMPIISTPSLTPPPKNVRSAPPNKQTVPAASLRSTTTGSTTTSSSASKKQPSKSIAPPPQPKLIKAKGKGDDDKSSGKDKDKNKSESTDEESGSMMDKFLRFFGNNTSVDDDTAGASGKNRTSGSPRSVASKFFSNLLESRTANKEQWVPVCPKTRLSPGEIVPVEVAGLDLIVVASKDAQNIYCMVNSCPHLGTPLETGSLERRPIEVNKDEATTPPIPGTFRKQPIQIQESDVAAMLANDGCEDCIVCPLHKTAFALKSGQVRGEWCPYPPVLGKMLASVKQANSAAVFDVRTRGKNIEVRLNTPLQEVDSGDAKDK